MHWRTFYRKGFAAAAACFTLLIHAPARAQEAGFTPGVLQPVVAAARIPQLQFALYLPKRYDPAQRYPVLYLFDGAGRAQLAAERFTEGADALGFIIVSMYAPAGGTTNAAYSLVPALINDTRERLAINPQRMYFGGLGAGAKFAYNFARQRGGAAGLVVCGSTLQGGTPLSRAMPFVVATACGNQDMNYNGLQNLAALLTQMNIPNRMFVFGGGNEWPPANICTEALTWLQVQAYKRKLETQHETWPHEQYAQKLQLADSLEKAGRKYSAFLYYTALATDFAGLADADIPVSSANRLRIDKEVEDSLLLQNAIVQQEGFILQRYQQHFANIIQSQGFGLDSKNEKAWRDEATQLQALMRGAATIDQANMVRRLQAAIRLTADEYAVQFLMQRNYDKAAGLAEVLQLTEPDNPSGYFYDACAAAQRGKTARAIDKLNEAVNRGWKDGRRIETEPLLEPLRREQDFFRLLMRLRGEPKTN
jgi:hypothetical protein